MLKEIAVLSKAEPGGDFAIVAAKYNPRYTDALVDAARTELTAGGARTIEIVRVPGAFEVPVAARALISRRKPRFHAVICFGAILRGATTHADHIAQAVSQALSQMQVMFGVPLIHGVLLFENEAQAEERCFGTKHNRGIEAARTAMEMASIMQQLTRKTPGRSGA